MLLSTVGCLRFLCSNAEDTVAVHWALEQELEMVDSLEGMVDMIPSKFRSLLTIALRLIERRLPFPAAPEQ